MPSLNHTHKYERVILRKRTKSNVPTKEDYVVYKCILPGCSHHVARNLAKSRESICWRCGKKFVLNMKHLRLRRPVCCKGAGTVIRQEETKHDDSQSENFMDFLDEILPQGK